MKQKKKKKNQGAIKRMLWKKQNGTLTTEAHIKLTKRWRPKGSTMMQKIVER